MKLTIITLFTIQLLTSGCTSVSDSNEWNHHNCQELGISFSCPSEYEITCYDNEVNLRLESESTMTFTIARHKSTSYTEESFFEVDGSDFLYNQFKKETFSTPNGTVYLKTKTNSTDSSLYVAIGLLETEHFDFVIYSFKKNPDLKRYIESIKPDLETLDSIIVNRPPDPVSTDFGEISIVVNDSLDYFINKETNNIQIKIANFDDLKDVWKKGIYLSINGFAVITKDQKNLIYQSEINTKQDSVSVSVQIELPENRGMKLARFNIPVKN